MAIPDVRNHLAFAEGLLLDEVVVPGSVPRRRARLTEPHVAPLDAWAQHVARRERRQVPSFDPRTGRPNRELLADALATAAARVT